MSDDISKFCARNRVNEVVLRACIAAGPFAVRSLMSNYHPFVGDDPPIPAKATPKPETRAEPIQSQPELSGKPLWAATVKALNGRGPMPPNAVLPNAPTPVPASVANEAESLVLANPTTAFPSADEDHTKAAWADAVSRLNAQTERRGTITSNQIMTAADKA